MKKKFISLRYARQKFESFLAKAGKLGFAPISPEREARNQVMQGIVPPDSPRIREVAGQVIVQKQVDNLTIRVITSYDPKEHKFTKAGKLWVLITTLSKKGKEEVIIPWKTTRTGKFLQRALWMMEMLSIALEKRPHDKSNVTLLTELESCAGDVPLHPYMWKGKRKGDLQVFINRLMLPTKELRDFHEKWVKYIWYYEKVVRVRKGRKLRERDIRKSYKRGVRKKESLGLE